MVLDISIYDLSKEALDVLIYKGIVEYIKRRSSIKIEKLVLYGINAEFVKFELINRFNFLSETGLESSECRIYDNIWHLDIDDLIDLYYRGNL